MEISLVLPDLTVVLKAGPVNIWNFILLIPYLMIGRVNKDFENACPLADQYNIGRSLLRIPVLASVKNGGLQTNFT